MKIQFETIKPVAKTDIQKVLYDGAVEALQKSIRTDIGKYREQLEGCEIVVKIDMIKSTASFSGENISNEQMKIIDNALDQAKQKASKLS